MTVGQEWSGYVGALGDVIAEVEHATRGLLELAMGGNGPAVGPLAQKEMLHVPTAAASEQHPGAGPGVRSLPGERGSGLLSGPACQPVAQRQ